MSVLWEPEQRSSSSAEAYARAEAHEAAHPERGFPEAGQLWDRAVPSDVDRGRVARLRAESEVALDRYLASAREEGRLNALGRLLFAGGVVSKIRARLAIDRALEEHPAVGRRRIRRPVFIVGGWRTGTTLLQRLLAHEPRLRAAHAWELTQPWEAAGADETVRARLMERAQQGHDQLRSLNPAMMVVHEFAAHLPEECILAMGTDFRSWFPTCQTRLPSYERWLVGEDFRPSYRLYRDVLALLQGGEGRRWVLKAPAHTPELESLLSVFPDACVVHLHRDPVATVASSCSLFATYRSTQSSEIDPVEIGREVLGQLRLWLSRADQARDRLSPDSPARFVDVDYRELVADPVQTAQKVLEAVGLEARGATAELFREHLEANRQHKLGRHVYRLEQFGLRPEEVREELRDYARRHDLEPGTPS